MSIAAPAFVSSGSTLWATPSKEWVIQPKPKPGRKPKQDSASATVVKNEDENEIKGRRVQNRAAQRAFRERKQSQLAELQARIQQYEQGEIERNVALQNIAKRLKEENDTLRRENTILRERMIKLEQDQQQQHSQEKKRWRETSPSSVSSEKGHTRKKSRLSPDSPVDSCLSASYIPSPPSMIESPDSTGTSDTRYSPVYDVQSHSAQSISILSTMTDLTHVKTININIDGNNTFPTFDCGFCSDDTPCVCRELAQQATARTGLQTFKSEDYTAIPPTRVVRLEPAPQSLPSCTSILENLPAYQPPVPLRRRVTPGVVNSVFPIQPLQTETRASSSSTPTCSGDPSNCLACADDVFGKEFCSAIEESVAARPPCVDSPAGSQISPQTCRGSRNCEGCASTPVIPSSNTSDTTDTIPTNDAWRQLKAHPNVSFADLSLLASVVASRAKCTGPRVLLSPPPESNITPLPPPPPLLPADDEAIILTDPHAQYREKERSERQSSSPRLVPQDVLVRCSQHRIREVPTSAVRDALSLLDGKFFK